MTHIRAFIAIDLPEFVQQALSRTSHILQDKFPSGSLRWVPVHNIHVTLQFLGEVREENVKAICQVIDYETAHRPVFELRVEGLGVFPSLHRPRVIWVGITRPPELTDLQKGIQNSLSRIGFPPEERPFAPHLTLARISQSASPEAIRRVGEITAASQIGELGTIHAVQVHLIRSDLRPSGAVYTYLHSASLREKTGAQP
jgi:2'-5' RNA ligase